MSYFKEKEEFKKDSKFQGKQRRGPRRPSPRMQQAVKDLKIDYKNFTSLQKFVNERGKVLSRRVSGLKAKEQRRLLEHIKRARFLALLPSGSVKR